MPLPNEDFKNQITDDQQAQLLAKVKAALAPNEANNKASEEKKLAQLKSPDPQKVKDLREIIDGLMLKSKEFATNRELSLAHTHIQRGFMWLGKVLQSLSVPNPYPESTNVSSPVIEVRTDQFKGDPINLSDIGDRTAIVKWFRNELDKCIEQIDFGYCNRAADNAEDALAEAKMWFGQELNNIRLASEK